MRKKKKVILIKCISKCIFGDTILVVVKKKHSAISTYMWKHSEHNSYGDCHYSSDNANDNVALYSDDNTSGVIIISDIIF